MFKCSVHRGLWINGLGTSEKCLRFNGLGVRGFRDILLRDY